MPDHGPVAEPERPASLTKTPADIYIVPCGTKLRIEAADGFEGGLAERHAATGNVFGDRV